MTALFRAVGALFSTFDGASKVSGLLIMCTVLYTGYMIPKPAMHPWLGWIFWIDPLSYGFEALLSIEFHDKSVIPCVGTNLIPTGPGYENVQAHQACAGVAGAIQGQNFVVGDNYLASLIQSLPCLAQLRYQLGLVGFVRLRHDCRDFEVAVTLRGGQHSGYPP